MLPVVGVPYADAPSFPAADGGYMHTADTAFTTNNYENMQFEKRRSGDFGQSAGMQHEAPGFLDDYLPGDVDESLDQVVFEEDENGAESGVPAVKRTLQRICDIINIIAAQGEALAFDISTSQFTVLDGALFEKEFLRLRKTKSPKETGGAGRVFAQMYRTYVITQGDRWGTSGTIFVAKSATTPLPTPINQGQSSPSHQPRDSVSPAAGHVDVSRTASSDPFTPSETMSPRPRSQEVSAENVSVFLTDANGRKEACSLQRFIDVTGIGELYSAAMTGRKRVRASNELDMSDLGPSAPLPADMWWASEGSAHRQQPLHHTQVGEVIGGVWNATSKGDQAYWFKRRDGVGKFENGSIVGLVGGVLMDCAAVASGGGLYMVVSDLNAKWKGEPIPVTPAEEAKGHWCCFLGQVPVTVRGPVRTGDCIGPSPTGGCIGEKVAVGSGPVIGVALDDKPSGDLGIVKTLCFAGLNALTSTENSQTEALVKKAVLLEQRMDELNFKTDAVVMAEMKTRRRVSSLERKVKSIYESRTMQIRVCAIVTALLIGVVAVTLIFVLRGDGSGTSSTSTFPSAQDGAVQAGAGSGGGSVSEKGPADCDFDGLNCANRTVIPTREAGFLYCCPPPCPNPNSCPTPPAEYTPCYAWEDFEGDCPILKCVALLDYCATGRWVFDPTPPYKNLP